MKRSVLLSTFLLAAVLTPMLLQTNYCDLEKYQKLATLELYVPDINGQNVISDFNPDGILYKVELPVDPPDTAVLLVQAQDATATIEVTYDSLPISLGPNGVAPLTLGTNHSEITVAVRGDSKVWTYTVSIDRVDYCPCDDGNECTQDFCNPANQVCLYPTVPDGSPCSEGRAECYGGVCGYFVSPSGDDGNPGTHEAPFRTISRAAQVAQFGDTITVQSGVYREWVRPAMGGYSEDTRITYRAAPGADVRILGSEPATGWVQTSGNVWAIELDESRFDGFNPFDTLTRHPEDVVTETGDVWGWLNYGRWTHLGDVYIDGVGLTEKQTIGEVEASPLSWRTETANGTTTIWANFGERDPNEAAVELNHRPFAFFPEQVGLGYITVKGFVIQNVATHWAPPQVFQPGAIGPNGGHHWVIEDNIVMYAKAVCISIGNPNGPGDLGASGYHLIRNNVIMRCGQSGITGEWWTKNSKIVDNHIEEINYRNEFGGAETAGIKHHFGFKLHIEGNFIRSVTAGHGIWADFINNNWRLEGNLVLGAGVYAMVAEANDGPNLFANNIFVGGGIGVYSSRADAWVHNLFINAPQTWVNQDYDDRPAIRDARWVNNIFIGDGLNSSIAPSGSRYSRNVFLDGAAPHPDDADPVIGSTPTDIEVLETSQGVALGFQVDEATLSAGYPLVDNETLELTFVIDATVDADFFAEQRSELSNIAGPFARLQPGRNEFTVYEYPSLYLKALSLTGNQCAGVDCDDQNACTDDVCNPADGSCTNPPSEDGTLCADGLCVAGECGPIGSILPCTEQGIRAAITTGGGPYTFDCAAPTTIVTAAEIVIDNNVILDGEGKLTVDGNGAHRVFSVASGVATELIGFTLSGGSTPEAGGGILNAGTLTLANSVVSGNTARFGGGIRNEGEGQAHVIDTMVSNNFATQGSGGISNRFATMTLTGSTVHANVATNNAGGIRNDGTLTLNDTTVSSNQAGGEAGGILNISGGTMAVTNSTVSGNQAADAGGGILNEESTMTLTNTTISSNNAGADGGGILNNQGTLTITGSTISENTGTTSGGGIENYSGSIEIDSSTVSGNTALAGGGGAIENPFPSGTLSLTNTTVSGNSSIGRGAIENLGAAVVIASTLSLNMPDGTFLWDGTGLVTIRSTVLDGSCKVLAVVNSLGGNIESEGNTCGLGHPTDQVSVPAPLLLLGPLQENGGPTMTHALLPGSAAIDWIPEAMCVDADGQVLTTDQRGQPRPAGPGCDVGSFEVQPVP